MGFASLFAKGILREINYVRAQNARIDRFNAWWHGLNEIHRLVVQDFVEPLNDVTAQMTSNEYTYLTTYIQEMNSWHDEINAHINDARMNHLSRYATAIKRTAVKSMKLCQKYKVYGDIQSVTYDATRKMILLNGRDQYCFG